ncbi:MAG TPA: hypothetical protein VJ862_08560 [Rhodanobacteraceae bacterium]|nr:hypothetical protein [Rhodanobacteraceae bacterium]
MKSAKTAVLAIVALLGLASTAANATVVYRWHTVSNTQYMAPVSGKLVFTDTAWLSGSVSYERRNGIPVPSPDPDSPILESLFTMSSPSGDPVFDINVNPVTGESNFDPIWFLDANFEFDPNSRFLIGYMSVLTTDSDYAMVSSNAGSLWTFTRFNTDEGMEGCHETGLCSGATGYWLRSVPEPGGLPFMGLGLVLLGIFGYVAARTPTRRL